jgi:formate dehydrogenase major subunit
VPIEYKPPAEESSLEYPFILTTGRVAVHHNAGSMTRRSPSLLERELDLFVEINAADAARLSISEGEEIVVTTPRGKTIALSRLTNRVGKGVVFMPFHFPETNILTSDARDAEARIPEFKISICKIARGC